MAVVALHHVNVTYPAALEQAVIGFYGETLGLTRVPKPPSQRSTGAWFQIGPQQLHLSIDPASRESQLAAFRHVCFQVDDLAAVEATLRAAGAPITPDATPLPGTKRLFTRDPAGNNVELTEYSEAS